MYYFENNDIKKLFESRKTHKNYWLLLEAVIFKGPNIHEFYKNLDLITGTEFELKSLNSDSTFKTPIFDRLDSIPIPEYKINQRRQLNVPLSKILSYKKTKYIYKLLIHYLFHDSNVYHNQELIFYMDSIYWKNLTEYEKYTYISIFLKELDIEEYFVVERKDDNNFYYHCIFDKPNSRSGNIDEPFTISKLLNNYKKLHPFFDMRLYCGNWNFYNEESFSFLTETKNKKSSFYFNPYAINEELVLAVLDNKIEINTEPYISKVYLDIVEDFRLGKEPLYWFNPRQSKLWEKALYFAHEIEEKNLISNFQNPIFDKKVLDLKEKMKERFKADSDFFKKNPSSFKNV